MYGLERCTPSRARRARTRLEEPERAGWPAARAGRGRGRPARSGLGRAPAWAAAARPAVGGRRTGRARPAARASLGSRVRAGVAAGVRGGLGLARRSGAGPRLARALLVRDPGPRSGSGDPMVSIPRLRHRLQAGERRVQGNARGGHRMSSGARLVRSATAQAAAAGCGSDRDQRLQRGPSSAGSSRCPAAEEAELHAGPRRPATSAPARRISCERGLGGAAGGEHVVDDQDPVAGAPGPRRAPRSRRCRTPGRTPG